jgi:hypothetical protein
MRRSHLFACVLLVTSLVAQSQSFYAIRRERSLMGSVGMGSANYFGELTNPRSLGLVKYGLNIGLERYVTNRIGGRLDFNWYRISGDDAKADDDRVVRNLSFASNNLELSTSLVINVLPNGLRFYQRPPFNLYVWLGFGVTYINPKTQYNGETVALQPLKTENVSYSKWQPIIPGGAGIKVKAGPFFNLGLEGGVRKTFTDYIDDISVKDYPDPATLSSDLSRALSDRSGGKASVRGNPESDDWYFIVTGKVQYYLPFSLGGSHRKTYSQKRKSISYGKKRRR